MLSLEFTNKFKKDYKKILSRGYYFSLFDEVILMLQNEIPLPPKFKDHSLIGEYKGFRECHIAPDWLLVYHVNNERLTLVLSRTGTHSDLF